MAFKFRNDLKIAFLDKQVLEDWCTGCITTKTAISRIAANNNCKELLEDEFIEKANSLGYRRE